MTSHLLRSIVGKRHSNVSTGGPSRHTGSPEQPHRRPGSPCVLRRSKRNCKEKAAQILHIVLGASKIKRDELTTLRCPLWATGSGDRARPQKPAGLSGRPTTILHTLSCQAPPLSYRDPTSAPCGLRSRQCPFHAALPRALSVLRAHLSGLICPPGSSHGILLELATCLKSRHLG